MTVPAWGLPFGASWVQLWVDELRRRGCHDPPRHLAPASPYGEPHRGPPPRPGQRQVSQRTPSEPGSLARSLTYRSWCSNIACPHPRSWTPWWRTNSPSSLTPMSGSSSLYSVSPTPTCPSGNLLHLLSMSVHLSHRGAKEGGTNADIHNFHFL